MKIAGFAGKKAMVAVGALCVLSTGVFAAGEFKHNLSGTKPWTHENFKNDPEEFRFAIIGDRCGGERPGFFGKAMDVLNLLRPEFVMSVGDLIDGCGASKEKLRRQWEEEQRFVKKLDMPFFHVVGNHDIWTGIKGPSKERQDSIDLWHEFHGTNTYYSFTYKGCHFICFNTMEKHEYFPPREPIPQHQFDWALAEMQKNKDARWHFIFMHKPLDWTSDRFLDFERKINHFNYSVFCGDWHNFCTATRHGKKYHMLGTVGGDWNGQVKHENLAYGTMDAVTLVTVTKDKGPVFAHVAISGVHSEVVQTCATTKGWIETPLDYPSHLAENPAKYSGETNTALIPAEVMHGPGYDWHFRHAVILRQGKVYDRKLQRFSAGKKRVVLLGDETATSLAKDYPKATHQIFDMGFAGDKIENVLWRVIQNELFGYEPDEIVISVGKHNKAANTAEEIAAGLKNLAAYVRERAPKAKVTVR